jgi:hypothetical protein
VKRIALLAGAVLALSLVTAPAALAADNETKACKDARVAEAKALTELRDAKDERQRVKLSAELKVELGADGKPDPDKIPGSITIGGLSVEFDGLAKVSAKEQAGLDVGAKEIDRAQRDYDKAVEKRKDKCDGDDVETTTTPPPTTVVEDNDVDCDEVSDEEAQRILDADRNDPNDLDQDNDNIACEDDEILPANDDEVVVPNGGVATGGGPA